MGFLSDLDKVNILSNGNNFLNQRQYGLAKIQFKRYLDTYGYKEGVVERKALCHMQLGEYREAITCYDTILSHGLNKFALNNKGHALNELRQPSTALIALNECTKYYPSYAEAWSNKGRSLAALARYSESFECYEKALEIKPHLYEAQVGLQFLIDKKNEYNNKAIELDSKGKYNEALKYYDKAIKITPNDSILYSNKGVTLRNKNDDENAIKAFEEALKYDNFNNMALDNLSILYNEKGIKADNAGNFEKAIEYYDKAIEMDPIDSILYSNKGVTLRNNNDKEGAIKAFEESLKYDRFNEIALDNLSHLYNSKGIEASKSGYHEKAIIYYDKSLEIDSEDPIVLCNKGLSLYKNNHKEESKKWFKKALDIDAKHKTALKYIEKLKDEEFFEKDYGYYAGNNEQYIEDYKIDNMENYIDKIERFFTMYEKGIITKEEFEIKKNEIREIGKTIEKQKTLEKEMIEKENALEIQALDLEKEGNRVFENGLHYHALDYFREAKELYKSMDLNNINARQGIIRCDERIKEIKRK